MLQIEARLLIRGSFDQIHDNFADTRKEIQCSLLIVTHHFVAINDIES